MRSTWLTCLFMNWEKMYFVSINLMLASNSNMAVTHNCHCPCKLFCSFTPMVQLKGQRQGSHSKFMNQWSGTVSLTLNPPHTDISGHFWYIFIQRIFIKMQTASIMLKKYAPQCTYYTQGFKLILACSQECNYVITVCACVCV